MYVLLSTLATSSVCGTESCCKIPKRAGAEVIVKKINARLCPTFSEQSRVTQLAIVSMHPLRYC